MKTKVLYFIENQRQTKQVQVSARNSNGERKVSWSNPAFYF